MLKFILPIGLIALGLFLGLLAQMLHNRNIIPGAVPVGSYMKRIQTAIFLGINPVVILGAFWNTRLDDYRYIFVPVLGVSALAIGGLLGFAASRVLKHQNKQKGAMFVSASFTNLGSFGGLVCFIFFGESSYALVALYKLFEEFFYFTVGFPIAKYYGKGDSAADNRHPFFRILSDPFIMLCLLGIAAGSLLNISGLKRPGFYTALNSALIPTMSFLLVITVGYSMKLKAIGRYLRECWIVSAVKFMLVSVIITSAAYLLGISHLGDGTAFKVILVLSAMPPAFLSLIPPQLYDLDVDLANSTWIFGTAALVVVIPALYIVQRLF